LQTVPAYWRRSESVSWLPHGLGNSAETTFPRRPEARSYFRCRRGLRPDRLVSSMFELATAFSALFSVSIFLAHAVEAYQAPQPDIDQPAFGAVVNWNAGCAGETTMQFGDASKFAWLLVLASHRWTKMLVRRQARPFEIIVGVAQGKIQTTGLQHRSSRRGQ
jgi:hypothetical protein